MKGVVEGNNGFVYTGQVQNGIPHGKGERVSQDGRMKFVGEWKNGKREGNCVVYIDGIKKFECEYKND
jgi:antitoxin component YwqK of YwqJK toxin-antitoxin module